MLDYYQSSRACVCVWKPIVREECSFLMNKMNALSSFLEQITIAAASCRRRHIFRKEAVSISTNTIWKECNMSCTIVLPVGMEILYLWIHVYGYFFWYSFRSYEWNCLPSGISKEWQFWFEIISCSSWEYKIRDCQLPENIVSFLKWVLYIYLLWFSYRTLFRDKP